MLSRHSQHVTASCVRSSRDRIRFQSSTWLVIVRGAWNGARADAWTGERKRRRRGAPSRLPCPPRRARAAAVWRVAACGLMGTGRTLNGTREVSAVFDFRFRARYEPQLVLQSVCAKRPGPRAYRVYTPYRVRLSKAFLTALPSGFGCVWIGAQETSPQKRRRLISIRPCQSARSSVASGRRARVSCAR